MKQSASGFQEEGFRPELDVERIIHEKDIMTVGTDSTGKNVSTSTHADRPILIRCYAEHPTPCSAS